MVLQRAHVISILKHFAIGEGFCKLGVLSGGPPSLFDMLLVTGGGSRM